ncbi:hypothetical protein SSS_00490 [Sarcoptes scabiei]|uniref:Uncharacterized protein n=1 Tax=Sarcoptes scabiei TaxID=52283 RepID=A0A132A586_SARSC|nr:hypothetical protein SSS_00490 [Sarcoptes scabiei]KPM06121.1 hypothetical protein QR98_0045940 [Sarcoptes scabiei]
MDFFIIASFFFVLVLFGILLFYVTRETSFEQAIEEQRNKNELDLLSNTNQNQGKHHHHDVQHNRKEKPKKSKELVAKESISKKQLKEKQSQHIEKKSQSNQQHAIEIDIKLASFSSDRPVSSVPIANSVASKEAKSIEKKNQSMISALPITDQPQSQQVSEPSVASEISRSKIDSKQSQTKTRHQEQESCLIVDTVDHSVHDDPETKIINNYNESKAFKKNKKLTNTRVVPAVREISLKGITESIKLFTKEDVTYLTDFLLNMQADQNKDLSWHKKKDPVDALKKQLAEREKVIDTQRNNLESARRKLESFQHELTVNKKMLQNENRLRKEIENERDNIRTMISDVEKRNKIQLDHLEEQHHTARQKEIASLNKLIEELRANNDSLKQKLVKEHDDLLEKLEEKDKLLDLGQQNLTKIRNEHKTEIELLEEKLKKLQDQHKVDLERTQTDSDCLKSSNVQLSSELIALKSEIDKLRDSLDKKSKELEEIKSKTDCYQNEFQSRLEGVMKEKNLLQAEIDRQSIQFQENQKIFNDICKRLNLNSNTEIEKICMKIEELKVEISKNENLGDSINEVNELYQALIEENKLLKQEIAEKEKKCTNLTNTLNETDQALIDIQDKIDKQKIDNESELRKIEKSLEQTKEESRIQLEKISLLSDENQRLKEQYEKTNELCLKKEMEISEFQNQLETLLDQLTKEKSDNRSLKMKIEKLNELVQIGIDTYQEENKKVQDLETKLATMNGNENGPKSPATTNVVNATTTNGN